MLLAEGSKLLISHRRLFEDDQIRFFFGTVKDYADGCAKVTGYSWTRDAQHGYQRKADLRTKIIALSTASLIIYELPSQTDIEQIHVKQTGGHSVVATDGGEFSMDLSERI